MLKFEYVDTHTHTEASFDVDKGRCNATDMVLAAKKAGLDGIVITDHLEVNSEIEGLYRKFDLPAWRADMKAAKERFGDYMKIGIELGQMTHYPTKAKEYLQSEGFEFVIGSIHNIRNTPDFALIDFKGKTKNYIDGLWDAYLDEYLEMCDFEGISTFAHLTYPLRYTAASGYRVEISESRDKICRILKKIKDRGASLEVNSSGFRRGMGESLPGAYVLKLYDSIGGTKVTLASDAHRPSDVGRDFDKIISLIKSI